MIMVDEKDDMWKEQEATRTLRMINLHVVSVLPLKTNSPPPPYDLDFHPTREK
jgi:hypothetical protein